MAFTPLSSLAGGLLIGASASALLVLDGRIAGISGIFAGVLPSGAEGKGPGREDRTWRFLFLGGLLVGGVLLRLLAPATIGAPATSPWTLVVAGLLVGFGTRMGGGCTSGHGVCGLSRLSRRSLAATLTFMVVGVLTATLVHFVGRVAP